MSTTTETQPVKSKVEQNVDINLDEIFNAAPSGADMIQDNKSQHKNIFSGLNEKADMSFADPDNDDATDVLSKLEEKEEKEEESNEELVDDKAEKKVEGTSIDEVFGDVSEEQEEEVKEKRGRKSILGISDVFSKLIKDDKIVPFDDEKSLDDYSEKTGKN